MAVLQAHTAIERLWAGACELYEGVGDDRRVNTQAVERIASAWRADHSLSGSPGDNAATIETEGNGSSTLFTITVPEPAAVSSETDQAFRYQTTVPDLKCDTP